MIIILVNYGEYEYFYSPSAIEMRIINKPSNL